MLKLVQGGCDMFNILLAAHLFGNIVFADEYFTPAR